MANEEEEEAAKTRKKEALIVFEKKMALNVSLLKILNETIFYIFYPLWIFLSFFTAAQQ